MSGKIITIGAMKGGVGKSTLAIQLAGCIANRGQSVLLVDSDTGKKDDGDEGVRTSDTFCNLRERAFDDGVPYIGHTLADNDFPIHVQLNDLKQRYDYVIVDTPGHSTTVFKSASVVSDVVLIVTLESMLSYSKLINVHETIEKIEENFSSVGIDKKINAVILYYDVKTKERPDIRRMDKYYAKKVYQTMSRSSVIIPNTRKLRLYVEKGLTVSDKESLHPSRAGFELLMDEIDGIRSPRFLRGEKYDYLEKLLKDDSIDE